LETLLGLALSFIVLANLILPRVWQAGGQRFLASSRIKVLLRLLPQKIADRKKRGSTPLGGNPFYSLASRDRSPQAITRVVLRSSLVFWFAFLLAAIFSAKHDPAFATCIFIAYGMHLFLKTLITVEASRRMSEDRQSGALELLLVTPLPVSVILTG